jgi:hypothetical protein
MVTLATKDEVLLPQIGKFANFPQMWHVGDLRICNLWLCDLWTQAVTELRT